MSTYLFAGGGMKNFIVLPSAVVDRYIKKASGEELKLLLYLIRNEDRALDADRISEDTGIPQSEIDGAVNFWIKNGVIMRRGGSLVLAAGTSDNGRLPSYNSETIAMRAESDKKWCALRTAAEQILGKLLNENDINTLFSIYDYLGMPDSVIVVLLEYCAGEGKTNMKYIEKTAISWSDEQIYTLEAAQKKADTLIKAKQLEGKIKSALGLGERNLTTKEKGFIEVWTNKFGYGLSEIVYAYEQSADNTGKISFPYMNRVLESAYKKGLKSADEMNNAPKPKAADNKKLKNNSTVSIDKDDLFVPFWEIMDGEEE